MKVNKMNKKEYIAVMASLVLVVAVGVGFGRSNDAEKVPEVKNPNQVSSAQTNNHAQLDTAQLEADEVSPVAAPKNVPAPSQEPKPAEETEIIKTGEAEEQKSDETPEEAATSQLYEDEYEEAGLFDDGITFMWPVKGEIAMDFSTDTVVYDPTLDQFRTNDTVCILADEGSNVACAGDGIVASVTNDYEKGTTVVVDHGDGWTTTYSQLMDNAAVEVGNTVKKGDNIGKISAPTKYGTAMGSHLEFKICQGETAIDPKVALND